MSKSTAAQVVTANTVREFFRADEKRVARLKDAKAAHTVADGARGRLHPEVIKAYNKGRKADRQYVEGVGKVVKADAQALRAKAVAAGAGKRGPLPKGLAETLSTPKA